MKKSIILNLLCKPVAMVISLIYAPIILEYLGVKKYGIWMTISSTANWILSFDVGIGNGLRNKLVKSIEKKEIALTKKIVSTAYISLFVISMLIVAFFLLVNLFFDWNKFFNTDEEINGTIVFTVLVVCITLVLTLVNTISFSLQKSEDVAVRAVFVQLINLFGIYFVTVLNIQANALFVVAILTGFSSIFVYLMESFRMFHSNEGLKPSIYYYDKEELHDICSLGMRFFFIQMVGVIMYSTDNIIITKLIDSEHVTSYSMVYKVFGLSLTVFNAILSPHWSKITQAKIYGDYKLIKKMIKRMLCLWIMLSAALIIAIFLYEPITTIWLHKNLLYDDGLIASMALYFIAYMYSGIFSTVLNGLGEVSIQMPVAVIAAIFNIPISILLASVAKMGSTGVCLGTVICLMFGNIIMTNQVRKIMGKK